MCITKNDFAAFSCGLSYVFTRFSSEATFGMIAEETAEAASYVCITLLAIQKLYTLYARVYNGDKPLCHRIADVIINTTHTLSGCTVGAAALLFTTIITTQLSINQQSSPNLRGSA